MNNVRYTGMTTVQAARTRETRIKDEQRQIAKAEANNKGESVPEVKPKKKRRFLFKRK